MKQTLSVVQADKSCKNLQVFALDLSSAQIQSPAALSPQVWSDLSSSQMACPTGSHSIISIMQIFLLLQAIFEKCFTRCGTLFQTQFINALKSQQHTGSHAEMCFVSNML